MSARFINQIGSLAIWPFPEFRAVPMSPRMDYPDDLLPPEALEKKLFFEGATSLNFPPGAVSAMVTGLSTPTIPGSIETLNILAAPERLRDTIKLNVWKITSLSAGGSSRNILRLYPEPRKEVLITLHLTSWEKAAVRAELTKHISTGLEIPIIY
ncbi:hypothetical protein APY94_00165 [Thermococcus celericrescens]|uniref:Uncharacterized protein n=1 Tax=Thermococcus celericrescens TaxID=227598 RepID=A0A100XZZ3_9EURY|nr:hypothetical protein [Thermococcus celericrescens]KUH34825.1 hypothetical protein APY94_00165 [Thermococcus celericrescens]